MSGCKDLICKLCEEYKIADKLAQEVSAWRLQAGVPAINELRYAGHHFIQSVNGSGEPENEDQIQKAINHCTRASYEASEAGMAHALMQLYNFKEDFDNVPIVDVIPEWVSVMAEMTAARDALGNSRSEAAEDRPTDYQAHMDHFRRLKPHVDRIGPAREELNKKMADRRNSSIRWRVGIIVTIVIALVMALVRLYAPSS